MQRRPLSKVTSVRIPKYLMDRVDSLLKERNKLLQTQYGSSGPFLRRSDMIRNLLTIGLETAERLKAK